MGFKKTNNRWKSQRKSSGNRDVEAKTFAHTEILQKHKPRNHNIYAKDL